MKKRSKQSKVSIKSILFVSFLIFGLSIFSTIRLNAITVSYDPPTYSSLTPHDPISITSDSGFDVFPGSGTEEDPYVIEGYNITTTSDEGIYIGVTTKYFVIRNCYVEADTIGIAIYDVADGTATVINNTCNNNYEGILLSSSGSSTVANNTCSNNDIVGISLYYSGSSTVTNNTCSNNNLYGIDLSSSSNSTVANNTCSNNNWGISLYDSDFCVVTYNLLQENDDNGIRFNLSDSSTITNNTCSNNGDGIYLTSSVNSTVANNTCNDNDVGIDISFSASSTVENNTCNNNNNYGIFLDSSDNSTVANNTCNNNNWDGIYLSRSSSATIANNTCNNNLRGIWLYYSDFCVVTYNLLQENEYYGVSLNSVSNNNLIHHNTFVDNNLVGTSQANDDGTNNYWFDTSINEGNYWPDWPGIGPYAIDGSAGAFDLYPLDKQPTVEVDPPLIADIIHSPPTPTELETISINATVTDASGVQSVTLHYRINGGTWIEVSMTLVSSDIYSVTIGSFAVGDTIEYFVSAIDNSINHNEATEDNSGLYYSFTVAEVIPEFQIFSHLLLAITLLSLVFGLVVLQRRKK